MKCEICGTDLPTPDVRRLERNSLHANGVHVGSCLDFGIALRKALGQ